MNTGGKRVDKLSYRVMADDAVAFIKAAKGL